MGIICPRAISHVTNHVINHVTSRNQRDPFLYNDRLLDNREFFFSIIFKNHNSFQNGANTFAIASSEWSWIFIWCSTVRALILSTENSRKLLRMLLRLTRDLTIEDFSDIDLSDITYDAYTSSMESLNKIKNRYAVNTEFNCLVRLFSATMDSPINDSIAPLRLPIFLVHHKIFSKLKTLLPRRRTNISRSQSLREPNFLGSGSRSLGRLNHLETRTASRKTDSDTLSLGDFPISNDKTKGILPFHTVSSRLVVLYACNVSWNATILFILLQTYV